MYRYIGHLNKILTTHKVCPSHGIDHAVAVMNHAENALNKATFTVDTRIKNCVLLAALLHDADDRKFFPNNKDYENLRSVIHDMACDDVELIIRMVSLVSSSKNGDSIPEDAVRNEWLLYPRYADRLEAIGIIGVERCYQYALTSKNPLYVATTPCVTTEEDMWTVATIERYNSYKGVSDSMIDHYYDKLLRAAMFPIRNEYFDSETNIRRKPSIDFVLMFGRNKSISDEEVKTFIKNHS
jgi:uncharacterized protein